MSGVRHAGGVDAEDILRMCCGEYETGSGEHGDDCELALDAQPVCGAVVHRHGTDLVCGLPAGHGGDEHNTAADGSGDAFPVRR